MNSPRLFFPFEEPVTSSMSRMMNIAALHTSQFMKVLASVLLCLGSVFAGKMDASIQEALYLFEMKGDYANATSLLERISKEGDQSDKEQAFFYLGKIQELSNNRQSANFYYNQSLVNTHKTNMAYWLAEREAITSNQSERLLQKPLMLPSPIRKVFGQSPTYLQLKNGSIKRIGAEGLENISTDIKANAEIYQITSQGIWHRADAEDSLRFTSFHSGKQSRNYDIFDITGFFEQDNRVIVQGSQSLSLINQNGAKITIPEKYNSCSIEGYHGPTKSYALNCPDNSLHLISAEAGVETKTISQFDAISKVLVEKKLIYLVSGNNFYCYAPKGSNTPLWKISVGTVEDIITFENSIAILESSGRLSLLDKRNGFVKASVLTETAIMSPLAQGTLGLFSSEGTIVAVDTLLRPIWFYNFLKSVETKPIHTEDAIYLNFGDTRLQSISPRYYGKKALLSTQIAKKASLLMENEQWDSLEVTLDTLFKVEPGNAEGWFLRAVYLEHKDASEKSIQQAWAEAVRLSTSNPRTAHVILERYSKAIGAKFVSQLPISPKTVYPQFFGGKKNLYTIDPAAGQIFNINPENGEIRWAKNIGKLDFNPVIGHDENTIAIATKYNMSLFELNKTSTATNIQLPGKAFDIKVFDDAIYVSTWNGFLLKVNRSENKQAWSRKVFSGTFLMTKENGKIYLCSQEGNLQMVDEISGLTDEGFSKKITGNITHMDQGDSTLVFATSANKLLIYNTKHPEAAPLQVLMDSPISSMQIVNNHGEKNILVNLANQSMLLYSESGAPIWKFNGKGSVFSKPFAKGNEIWLDQGSEIISVAMKDGKITKRYSTPGGSGTPFITNNTLFSASPKRILYGFPL